MIFISIRAAIAIHPYRFGFAPSNFSKSLIFFFFSF